MWKSRKVSCRARCAQCASQASSLRFSACCSQWGWAKNATGSKALAAGRCVDTEMKRNSVSCSQVQSASSSIRPGAGSSMPTPSSKARGAGMGLPGSMRGPQSVSQLSPLGIERQASSLIFFARCEKLHTFADAAQAMAAERAQGGRKVPCHGLGDEEPHPQVLAQRLDARRLVRRGADHRELDAAGGAHVAVEHVAEVQADAEAERA